MFAAVVVSIIAAVLGSANVAALAMFPVSLVIVAMFFTSIYFTFKDSFVDDAVEKIDAEIV